MKVRHLACAVALSLFAIGGAVVACGGSGDPKVANVPAGEMPAGQEWAGVYYNQVFGNLHMTEEGGKVYARWKRSTGTHWGELSGTVQGNVLRFKWDERQYGQTGPHAHQSGKGYFVFKLGENDIPVLKGEYGVGADETGSAWDAIKQMNVKPDPKSIQGELGGSELPAQPDEWDGDPNKKPKPTPTVTAPPAPTEEAATDAGAAPPKDAATDAKKK